MGKKALLSNVLRLTLSQITVCNVTELVELLTLLSLQLPVAFSHFKLISLVWQNIWSSLNGPNKLVIPRHFLKYHQPVEPFSYPVKYLNIMHCHKFWYRAQRMNPNDFGYPLSFPPAPPASWHFWFRMKYLNNYFIDCHKMCNKHSRSPDRMNYNDAGDSLTFLIEPSWGQNVLNTLVCTCKSNAISNSLSCTVSFLLISKC